MRPLHRLLIIAGFTLVFGSEAVFIIVLSRPDGVRIRSPERTVTLGRTFVVSGDAWMRGGVDRIEVMAAPKGAQALAPIAFPANRDVVRYRGQPLFPLSTWSTRVELPGDGEWSLQAVALGSSGGYAFSTVKAVHIRAGTQPREFRSWSVEHLAPIGLIIAAAIGLGLLARRPGLYDRIALLCTAVIWVNEIAYQLYWFLVGGWATPAALMFQMCGLSILLLPVMHFAKDERTRQFLFDILYFWGIGGALQALLSPDIGANGFPAYRYFSFFLSHGLIIALTMIMALAGRVRITIRSFLRAFVVTNLALIPIYGLDMLLRLIPPYDPGNYFVLGYPPPTGSPVDLLSDLFGPSPRYVIGLELMGIVIFLIMYAPWPIARALRSRQRGAR